MTTSSSAHKSGDRTMAIPSPLQRRSALASEVLTANECVVTAGAALLARAARRVVTRRLVACTSACGLGRSAGRAVIGAVHPGEAPTRARAALLRMSISMRERDRNRGEGDDAERSQGAYQTT
jgi:hypothetical protein